MDVCVWSLFCYAVLNFLSSFAVTMYLIGEVRAGCFTLIVFLLLCGCLCSVSLPHGAVGWSAVCECGISWSYLLTCCISDLFGFNVAAPFINSRI